MEPPFTRDRLKTIADEFFRHEEEKYIDGVVQWIQDQIIAKAYTECLGARNAHYMVQMFGNSKCGLFKLKVDIPFSIPNKGPKHNCVVAQPINVLKSYTPMIVAKLQVIFPDMAILVDPLQTYVLFDWS